MIERELLLSIYEKELNLHIKSYYIYYLSLRKYRSCAYCEKNIPIKICLDCNIISSCENKKCNSLFLSHKILKCEEMREILNDYTKNSKV